MMPSATSMLTIWLDTRGRLWFDPLKITTRPTPISNSIVASSWPSTCAVTTRTARLITGAITLQLSCFRHLAEKVVIEHGARNRRCGYSSEAGVFDDHGKGDLGRVSRRVRNK